MKRAQLTQEVEALSEQDRARLRERAARLGAEEPGELTSQPMHLARFRVGELECALPLEQLRAILPLKSVTPVPLAASHVLGVIRYEGSIVAAMSLGMLLGAKGWRRDPQVLGIVAYGDGRRVAFDFEEAPAAVVMDARLLEAARNGRRRALTDIVVPGEATITFIDPTELLARGRHG